jgi:hypothetical protein
VPLAVKRGIKVWIRCDSATGFLHQFDIYLGKRKSGTASPNGLMFDVIDRLTRDIRGGGFRVFFDNAYTGIPLLIHLHENEIDAAGTIVQNRKFVPKGWPTKKLVRGQHIWLQDANHPNMTIAAWQDTKVVRFACNFVEPEANAVTERRVRNTRIQVNQPMSGHLYNSNYGGVDRFDQWRAAYGVGRFSKKCWKYLFHFFINSALVNSWLLFRETSQRPQSRSRYEQLDFRKELVLELVAGFSHIERSVTTLPTHFGPGAQVNIASHQNVHMNAKAVHTCVGHKTFTPDGRPKKRTAFGCKTCNVHLCKECHPLFHSAR